MNIEVIKMVAWKTKKKNDIRKLLKGRFSGAKFRIKIDTYKGGETILIHTNLIKPIGKYLILKNKDKYEKVNMKRYILLREKHHNNIMIYSEISRLLSTYKYIDRDIHGKILNSDNSYLIVKGLNEY